MPVYEKLNGYTVVAPFVAGGGIYTEADAASLIMWARFKPVPKDDKSGLTLTYDGGSGSPASLLNLPIPSRADSRIEDLPVAGFDTSSASLKIAANAALQFGAPVPGASTDKPFTLATWIKVDQIGAGAGQPIFTMTGASGTQFAIYIQYVIYSDNEAKIQVSLQDTVNSGTKVVGFNWKHPTQIDEILAPNWQHLAFTFSGKISDPDYGFKAYSNGKRLPSTAETSAGTYVGMAISTANNVSRVGSGLGGTPDSFASFSEFCAWGSDLSHSAIKALYAITGGRYTAKSGIISLPNRVRLREVDSLTGSYPPHARTTGAKGSRKGTGPSTFNDNHTQIFKNPASSAEDPTITFPLVNTADQMERQDLKNLIATPNQNSSLKVYWQPSNDSTPATKGPTPHISTQGTRKIVSYGMDFEPFDETRVLLGPKDETFYASGTRRSTYPGYGSPLRDKIAISVPIYNNSEKYVGRYNNRDLYIDKNGLFPNHGHHTTGFSYYNFTSGKWEDKGLNEDTCMFYRADSFFFNFATIYPSFDPVGLGTKIRKTASNWMAPWNSYQQGGSWPKMQQFKMSDHMAVFVDSIADSTSGSNTREEQWGVLTSSLNYDKIGAPTVAGLGPWHERYHATGSQTMRMDQWLTEDLLLEKAVLEIPVVVQRAHGVRATIGNLGGVPAQSRYYGSCRDIDNYTFFLYKQRRNTKGAPVDSPNDVSGSTRQLIASGCASFYNSEAFSGRVPGLIREKGLPHTPAYSYDFLQPSGSHTSEGPFDGSPTAVFSGTIRIEMEAAVANAQFLGASRYPLLNLSASNAAAGLFALPHWYGFTSVVTQDFWGGGVTMPSASVEANSGYNFFMAGPINGFVKAPGTFGGGGWNFSVAAGLHPYASTGSNNTFIQTSVVPDAYKNMVGNPQVKNSERSLLQGVGFGRRDVGADMRTIVLNGSSSGGMVTDENQVGILGYTNLGYAYPIFIGGRPISQTSPFLLKPEDELVLGVDAGVSMIPSSGTLNLMLYAFGVDAGVDLGLAQGSASYVAGGGETFSEMSGSFMKIMQGEAKLTLFGSQVKLNKERLYETNQNLTSDAIHEAMGDERVLDQFDLASRLDLSGSYVDRLVAGTMNVPRLGALTRRDALTASINAANGAIYDGGGLNYVGTTFIDGIRGKIRRNVGLFSRNWAGLYPPTASVSPPLEIVPSPSIFAPDGLRSIGTPPRSYSLSGLSPNNVFMTNGEIWLDPFNVSNMRTAILGDGSNNKKNVSLQRFVTIPALGRTYYDSMAPDISQYCDRQTNPAHEQFYAVKTKNIWPNYDGFVVPPGGAAKPRQSVSVVPQYNVWAYPPISGVFPYPYEGNPSRFLDQRININILSERQGTAGIANFIYSAGPFYGGRTARMALFSRGYDWTFTHSDGKTHVRVQGEVTGAHGPRFGMISPVNRSPTSVFRRDRFGQYRDMLEQQLDTKYYNSLASLTANSPGSKYLSVRQELVGVQDSPIQVKFVDITNGSVIVSPYTTDSTNFSNEYTASIPFADYGADGPLLLRFIPLDSSIFYAFGGGVPFTGATAGMGAGGAGSFVLSS